MESLEKYFSELTGCREPKNLYQPICYALLQGGKRLRPRMVIYSTRLFGGDEQAAIHPAAAFEMLHNFTLVHDDIMDNAPLRRGKPTVYRQWDSNIAILSGDALATMALLEVLATPVKPETVIALTKLLSQTSIEICEGQQLDLDFEKMDEVSIEEYIHMINGKTAVMFAGCLKAGAMLSYASEEDQKHIYQYGINLGLAFQLRDDLLDVYGDDEVFGKEIGGDIRENKKTYLYLRALQDADSTQKNILKDCFSSDCIDEKQKFARVTQVYDQLSIRKKTEDEIERLVQLALDELNQIQSSDEKARETLIHLVQDLSSRTK